MTQVWADRVKDTTTTTGTGTITLSGTAPAQFQNFSVVGNGNTCDYCILSGDGANWETGQGTYSSTGPTLARTTIYESSNSNAAINLSGTSTVFLSLVASEISTLSTGLFSQIISAAPTQTSTGLTAFLNQTTGTTATNGATGLAVQAPANSSTHIFSGLKATAPSTPYSISALVAIDVPWSNYGGAIFGFSDGTKGVAFRPEATDGLFVSEIPTLASSSSPTTAYSEGVANLDLWWFKIRDDGTTIYFYVCRDGFSWRLLYSQARTSYLSSPSLIVFGCDAYSFAVTATLLSWIQGTS